MQLTDKLQNQVGSRVGEVLTIIITGLGLFGLAAYTTEQRTKEIGIRRINGAGVGQVLFLLNMDFVKWVIIAIVIALPVEIFVMNRWLQNYAYRISLSWWIFITSGVIAVFIALVTVSWLSWRAAKQNPSDALRYE